MDFWLPTFHKENDKSSWLHDWLGAVAHCCCPALWENVILHIARPEKDWNSKLKVCLLLNAYYFPTIIKKKNCKSNQCKLGTSCVIPDNMRGPEWISFKLLKLDWYFSKVQKKFHLQKQLWTMPMESILCSVLFSFLFMNNSFSVCHGDLFTQTSQSYKPIFVIHIYYIDIIPYNYAIYDLYTYIQTYIYMMICIIVGLFLWLNLTDFYSLKFLGPLYLHLILMVKPKC